MKKTYLFLGSEKTKRAFSDQACRTQIPNYFRILYKEFKLKDWPFYETRTF